MHSDLERLLSSKKITPALAQKLDAVSPGNYCLHRTWATGKVISWSLKTKEVLIDFEGKEGTHTMALEFVMKKLISLPVEHFLVERFNDLKQLQALYKSEPLVLLEKVVQGHGGEIKPEDVELVLKGTVIPEAEFKNWWERTKTAARAQTRFIIPTRKGEMIKMREEGLSKTAAIFSDYTANRDLKSRVRILESVSVDVLIKDENPDQTLALLAEVDADIERGGKLALQQVLELAVLRDDLLAKLPEDRKTTPTSTLASLMTNFDNGSGLCQIIAAIPGTRQKKIYEAFPVAFGANATKEALRVFDFAGTRATAEVAKYLLTDEYKEAFYDHLRLGISRHSLHTDALIWICRERENGAKPVFGYDVASALLAHLDKDHSESGNSGVLRLKNYIMDTKTLIKDLMEKASVNDIRRFAKTLMNCAALPDLERKSLFARVIAIEPSVHELILRTEKKEEEEDLALVVSWESLRRKKEELEDVVSRRIPENVRDIAIARDHGDLRENGDYKAAKEEQAKLARQRGELERDIDLARGTDFAQVDTSSVNIGTVVTLVDEAGVKTQYSILGAWDSDPEKHILSYKSAIGQSFLGRKVGDTLAFNLENPQKPLTYTVSNIEAYNKAN